MSNTMSSEFDIVVAGAGISGVMAAVSAARSGARTLLVEKNDFLGGVGYSGLFQHICGLYLNGNVFPNETLNPGIAREIAALLNKLSPQRMIKKIGLVYVIPYERENLLSALNFMCYNEPHLTVLLNTAVTSVENKMGNITEITINHSGSMRRIFPKFVIDCSGSGAVSAMAGASFELSTNEKIQLAGYVVHINGMKGMEDTLPIKVPYYLSKGVMENILPQYMKFTVFSPGDSLGEGYLKMSIDYAEDIERERRAAQDASIMHRYLADTIPAFKDSYISEASMRVMDREGKRICGEYTLTEEDVLNARKFDDGVVKNSWPIELWDKDRGTIYKYVKRGDYYEIPFRCLKVKGIKNLLCAGRCISVDSEALGSTRVMGTCMALGEQAGIAAAYKVKNGVYPAYTKENLHKNN